MFTVLERNYILINSIIIINFVWIKFDLIPCNIYLTCVSLPVNLGIHKLSSEQHLSYNPCLPLYKTLSVGVLLWILIQYPTHQLFWSCRLLFPKYVAFLSVFFLFFVCPFSTYQASDSVDGSIIMQVRHSFSIIVISALLFSNFVFVGIGKSYTTIYFSEFSTF